MKRGERVKEIFQKLGGVVVAFSGGVDSTVLLKLALEALGKEKVLAVTAFSPTYPKKEVEEAKKMSELLGAEHLIIQTKELENPSFSQNPPDRCYHCKRELFAELKKIGEERGLPCVVDGSNADDLKDYRPGRKAAEEMGIRSPLAEAGLSKEEIRKIAKTYSLPNWNKPSFACLASRIPYGIAITQKRLKKIEKGEEFLVSLGLKTVRLRDHGNIARLEIDPEDLKKIIQPEIREAIVKKLKELGFLYISLDLEGYKSGSLNKMLPKKPT